MVLTLAQKQALAVKAKAGKKIATTAYNPAVGTGPETKATAAGWAQEQRQATANLVEVIHSK